MKWGPYMLGQGESTHSLVFIVKTDKMEDFCFKHFDIKFGLQNIKLA